MKERTRYLATKTKFFAATVLQWDDAQRDDKSERGVDMSIEEEALLEVSSVIAE